MHQFRSVDSRNEQKGEIFEDTIHTSALSPSAIIPQPHRRLVERFLTWKTKDSDNIELKDDDDDDDKKIIEDKDLEFPSCNPIKIEFTDLSVYIKALETVNLSPLNRALGFLGLAPQKYEKKTIIHNVSGFLEPYKLTALMGPSGSGKTTLLNSLSQRISSYEGGITYNSLTATEEMAKSSTGFVQQLDLFIASITAEEHLQIQADLRLRSYPENVRKERVSLIIDKLRLRKAATLLIGNESTAGLSGGEKKRLNVASELLTLPSVLFADEPTTGLDSATAYSVIDALRNMANSGRTVVTTIHQPSLKIFNMFDEIILLSEGRLLYSGHRQGCMAWFSKLGFQCPKYSNPADFIIKVINLPEDPVEKDKKIQQIIKWSETWKAEGEEFLKKLQDQTNKQARPKNGDKVAPKKSLEIFQGVQNEHPTEKTDSYITVPLKGDSSNETRKTIPGILKTIQKWGYEVTVLSKRDVISNVRNKPQSIARLLQALGTALIFSLMFFRLGWTEDDTMSRMGAINSVIMNQVMSGAFMVLHSFTENKATIQRELDAGLFFPSSYMTAKMISDIQTQISLPIIFGTITFWVMGLRDKFLVFSVFLVTLTLTSLSAASIGYISSALGSSTEGAVMINNLLIFPLTICSGFMINNDDIPSFLIWLKYISFCFYGFNASSVAILDGTNTMTSKGPVDSIEFVTSRLALNKNIYLLCYLILGVLVIVYRFLGCVAYSFSSKRHRENE